MYYNNKLVYKKVLGSGTIVFDENLQIFYGDTKIITLKNVEIGMTNVSKGLNVSFKLSHTSDTQFASVEDLKKGIQFRIGSRSDCLKLAWKHGTNRLYAKALSSNVSLVKLTIA